MDTLTPERRAAMKPAEALQLLKEGNERFVSNLKLNRDLLKQVNETANGQYPFAVVLSCMDSRTTAELIFDQGLGDMFSVRIAGNVINEDILGSMEYACRVVGSKLIVVMGHTNCGAVKGACDQVELSHLTPLLTKIRPAINQEKTIKKNRTSGNASFVEKVAAINVEHSMQAIITRSIVLKEMIDEKRVGLVGAKYDVASGQVNFFPASLGLEE